LNLRINLPHTYVHTYIHTYIHAYMHTYTHTYVYTSVHIFFRSSAPSFCIHTHTYINTYIHTYIHTYIQTCMHISIHTYIHTYTQSLVSKAQEYTCTWRSSTIPALTTIFLNSSASSFHNALPSILVKESKAPVSLILSASGSSM
jgi:hypothetical protein